MCCSYQEYKIDSYTGIYSLNLYSTSSGSQGGAHTTAFSNFPHNILGSWLVCRLIKIHSVTFSDSSWIWIFPGLAHHQYHTVSSNTFSVFHTVVRHVAIALLIKKRLEETKIGEKKWRCGNWLSHQLQFHHYG